MRFIRRSKFVTQRIRYRRIDSSNIFLEEIGERMAFVKKQSLRENVDLRKKRGTDLREGSSKNKFLKK